jgi:hypothetical protein
MLFGFTLIKLEVVMMTVQKTDYRWMRSMRILALVALIVVTLATFVAPAQAQNYSFSVPELRMNVYVQSDAAVRIVYDITFKNNPGAHPIDIVDIGTPKDTYDLDTMTATLNGEPLPTIRDSEYIDVGVEIPLGIHEIPPGGTGMLHVEFTIPDFVYQDTTRDDYASLRITPTWFDSDAVTGSGTIRVAIHTLPGINPDDVLYQNEKEPFDDKQVIEDRAVVVWVWENSPANQEYPVGVSFPKQGMERVIELTTFDLFLMWIEDNTFFFVIAAMIFFFLLSIGLNILSGKKGCLTIVAILGIGIFILVVPGGLFFAIPIAIFLINLLKEIQSKDKYLPAIAQVEGGGIKRGLTAAEAAVILEVPPNKVLALIIFGMLKKGLVQQVKSDPLEVAVVDAFKGQDKTQRLKTAQQLGIVIHSYEHDFLDAMEEKTGKPIHEINLKNPMKKFVKYAAKRVEGFDLSDTQDYYRRIIKKAMDQAQAMVDNTAFEQDVDRNLEWILMNKDYRTTFDSRRDYDYRPIWIRTSYGGSSGGSIGGLSGGGDSSSGGSGVKFGDVAGSFAGWFENTTGKIADTITPEALGTAPKPVVSHNRSSGGGCACAGCACACACAGGGR